MAPKGLKLTIQLIAGRGSSITEAARPDSVAEKYLGPSLKDRWQAGRRQSRSSNRSRGGERRISGGRMTVGGLQIDNEADKEGDRAG